MDEIKQSGGGFDPSHFDLGGSASFGFNIILDAGLADEGLDSARTYGVPFFVASMREVLR
jgi:hypothetical protein